MGAIDIGYRSGKLTVAEPTDQRKAGYVVWKCRCDCGGEILLDTRSLQRGMMRDCGCVSVMRPRQRDISGKRFGMLIAQEPTKKRSSKGGIMWKCRCDCGNEILADAGQLTMGNRKSCGCLGHPPLKDFIGKRFGKLTVTEYAGKKAGMHRWKCTCDCGRETVVGQTLLQSGKTKSCGCLQAVIYKENLQLVDGTSVTILKAVKGGRLMKSNKSGYNGVYYNERRNRWVAQITFQNKTKYLGSYEHLEDAVKARLRGEEIFDEFLEKLEVAGSEKETGISGEGGCLTKVDVTS